MTPAEPPSVAIAIAIAIAIAVVDDDPLVRAGLRLMLDGTAGLVVVGEADDGDGVPELVRVCAPQVVLMDLRMARVDGVVATAALRARPRPPEVLVLTTFDTDENVVRALRAGASGFLLKDTPPAAIVAAIRAVAAGEPAMSPQVTRRLMARVAAQDGAAYEQAQLILQTLTARELDVARALARGQTNAEIATALFLSVATVKAYLTRVLSKLGLSNRTQVALLLHDARMD